MNDVDRRDHLSATACSSPTSGEASRVSSEIFCEAVCERRGEFSGPVRRDAPRETNQGEVLVEFDGTAYRIIKYRE
jgi:hypothetical protein